MLQIQRQVEFRIFPDIRLHLCQNLEKYFSSRKFSRVFRLTKFDNINDSSDIFASKIFQNHLET